MVAVAAGDAEDIRLFFRRPGGAFAGQIAGMAGAYGNVGAVIYLVVFSLVDARTFFFILSAGALVSFVITLLMLEEPDGSFAETFEEEDEEEDPAEGTIPSRT